MRIFFSGQLNRQWNIDFPIAIYIHTCINRIRYNLRNIVRRESGISNIVQLIGNPRTLLFVERRTEGDTRFQKTFVGNIIQKIKNRCISANKSNSI